ncbi:MAG: class I SAM-dependent methyltransferase [Chloroflexi bacterium]|nr:class I SAM-dependent methyltransferase [Chloroflexota bacterium]MCI0856546.1 class I SAM-dependent methyltransferase [Chloroflexota bacterium]MCI0889988.1 class I SAM-dependent methyltransferase [Chloroflexota bacterium]
MASSEDAQAWQVGIWDRKSQNYLQETDKRFRPIHEALLDRSGLGGNQSVLDIGTGTGSVAIAAAHAVGEGGDVTGTDISADMLAVAEGRLVDETNLVFRLGSAEEIPAVDGSFHVVLASLSMMYVIDRAAAAREIARVLRPGGRFVAAVWSGPDDCDIVKFQTAAGAFAPKPPVAGVGPGALADPLPFQAQLLDAGIDTEVETEELGFDYDDFESAWEVLAGVTTASLEPERVEEAKLAVQAAMWPNGEGPRHFRNVTQFIVGNKG